MLYVSDANFAVIRQDYVLRLKGMDIDVDLPCEDKEYNEMVIPIFISGQISSLLNRTTAYSTGKNDIRRVS
jgi:hypothetical protein